MIAPMKKVTILIYDQVRDEFLSRLQDNGLVHIVEKAPGVTSENLTKFQDTLNRIQKSSRSLAALPESEEKAHQVQPESIEKLLDEIETLFSRVDTIQQRLNMFEKRRQLLEPWGNYDPGLLKRLEAAGITTRFFTASQAKFRTLDLSGLYTQVVHTSESETYFVIFEKGKKADVDCEEVFLPEQNLAYVTMAIEENKKLEERTVHTLIVYDKYLDYLAEQERLYQNRVAYETTLLNLSEEAKGSVQVLQGWIPAEKELNLENFLLRNKVTFFFEDPKQDEAAPILLKNNRFSRLFEPIIKLFQNPNYREIDPTPAVAPFYAVFFGNCLGDAGYAIIIIIASIIAVFKVSKTFKKFAYFGVILGLSTFIMGLINSGTLFGITIGNFKDTPVFGFLDKFTLVRNGQTIDPFNFALLLGVVQINVGMVLNIVNRVVYNSLKNASTGLAKLCIIDNLIILFLAKYQNIAALQPFIKLSVVGLVFGFGLMVYAIIIAGQDKLMENGVASLIFKLYFTVSGAVGDILSYIRLFALGLSSGILGYVINDIGRQFLGIQYIGWVIFICFLVLGHTINLLIAMLGSFVHPLRLTFVEFYNNLEFKGGGVEYTPFKKQHKLLD